MFLLDTNTLIYFLKGMGNVAERLLSTPPSEIALSTVTLYELEVGLEKTKNPRQRRRQLDEMLGLVRLLPFGAEEARAAARVRASLEQAGTPIGPIDNLIAGIAVAHRATLVTHNLGEFNRVRGLKATDWF